MRRSKTISRKCCAVYIPPKRLKVAEPAGFGGEIQLTKLQTTHCFLAISDYIALQRVGCARSIWPGFLFGCRSSFANLPLGRLRPPEFQVLSVIRKSGSRFSGEIALQPLHDPEEEP